MSFLVEATDDLENLLRDEVTFWQDYIKSHKEPVILVRAIEALDLAEKKLAMFKRIDNRHISQIQMFTEH